MSLILKVYMQSIWNNLIDMTDLMDGKEGNYHTIFPCLQREYMGNYLKLDRKIFS